MADEKEKKPRAPKTMKTPEQKIEFHLKAAKRVAQEAKQKARTREANLKYLFGALFLNDVAAGRPEVLKLQQEYINGLTRKHDRLLVGLEPLPGTEKDPLPGPDDPTPEAVLSEPVTRPELSVPPLRPSSSLNPPAPSALQDAARRLTEASTVYQKSNQYAADKGALIQAVIAWESLSGACWAELPIRRADAGLSERPGERL